MDNRQTAEVKALVKKSLDTAEAHWQRGGHKLAVAAQKRRFEDAKSFSDVETQIPNHPMVSLDETIIDEFIALVADLRGSTEHLLCEISPKKATASGLERVYYETSALLPACAKAVQFYGGNVTEYLGDGVLALFAVDENERDEAVYSAHRAAKSIASQVSEIVSSEIDQRYCLPKIEVGVGIAYSRAMVTVVGLEDYAQAKAYGECVFRASKMANENANRNSVFADDKLEAIWPTVDSGGLKFQKKSLGSFDAYRVYPPANRA